MGESRQRQPSYARLVDHRSEIATVRNAHGQTSSSHLRGSMHQTSGWIVCPTDVGSSRTHKLERLHGGLSALRKIGPSMAHYMCQHISTHQRCAVAPLEKSITLRCS